MWTLGPKGVKALCSRMPDGLFCGIIQILYVYVHSSNTPNTTEDFNLEQFNQFVQCILHVQSWNISQLKINKIIPLHRTGSKQLKA